MDLICSLTEQSNCMTNKMEDHHQLHSQSCMPLLSRVDHLDSVMKQAEKKKKIECFSVWSNYTRRSIVRKNSKRTMALNVATQESHSKGSLIDRIRSLEDRLLQLYQEIDQASSKASSSTSIQSTSLWTTSSSSNAQSKPELPVSSYPTFSCPNITHDCKLASHEYFQRMKNPKNDAQQPQQQDEENDNEKETTCCDGKMKKKTRSPCWPRFKLLGC